MRNLVALSPTCALRPRAGTSLCVLLAAAACALAQPNTQKMIGSSVTVYGLTLQRGEVKPAMRGGGVVLDARHVIADVDMCCSRTDKGEPLTPRVELGDYVSGARMVWKSPDSDMVILEMERPIDLPAASLSPSKFANNGQVVYTVNFPPNGVGPRVQQGQLTDRKKFPGKALALHAATTPMDRLNTGGGLFDACGNVIGITVQFKNGELLAWFIDGLAEGLKETGIKLEIANSSCGGAGSETSSGGGTGGGATGGNGKSGGGTGGTGDKNFLSKMTTTQWVTIGVIVGIFALGFLPGPRQQVVRAMTRKRSPLPEPLPYPYAGPPPVGPPPVYGGVPPPVGPPPVYGGMPPPVAPPPVYGGSPPPVFSPPAPPAYGAPAPPYGAPMPPSPPPPLLGGRPALVGVAGHYTGSSIALDAGPSTLGRDHSNVNLVFPPDANAISKRHCRVSWDISRRVFVLEDLGSTNGTFMANGERVNPGQPRDLRPGDRFYLGDPRNQFEVKMES